MQTLTPTGAPSLFGGVGRLEWSSATPDDPFPVWQDITVFVRTEGNPLQITRGRQSELDQGQPAQLTCDLDNTDSRFTFGYTAGPYGSTWTPAKQIRYSETIGLRTFVLYKGWIEYPEIADWQPIGLQYVQLTCTDRLTRLARGKAFKSALAEWIVNQNNGNLKGYWPMNEAAEPFYGYGPVTDPLDMQRFRTGTSGLVGEVQPQTGLAPDGAEASSVRCISHPEGPGHAFIWTYLPSTFAPAVAADDAIKVVFWFSLAPSMSANDATFQQIVAFSGPSCTLSLERNTSTGVWTLTASGGLTGSITGGAVGISALMPVGIFLDEGAQEMQLWTGSIKQTASLTGAAVGAGTFAWGGLGYQLDYDISNIQVYIGNGWSYVRYSQQIPQAYAPLEYQTTGERINTLLNYAGIAAGDRLIDPGQSYMAAAQLAGVDPGAAIANAVNTERGRGFAGGDGRYVFHDRIRTLNV